MNSLMFKLVLDQIANTRWIMERAREFQKNIYFCFIDYAKALDCADHNKLWKILKEELPRSVGAQHATGDQWRNNSRKNEGMESK